MEIEIVMSGWSRLETKRILKMVKELTRKED